MAVLYLKATTCHHPKSKNFQTPDTNSWKSGVRKSKSKIAKSHVSTTRKLCSLPSLKSLHFFTTHSPLHFVASHSIQENIVYSYLKFNINISTYCNNEHQKEDPGAANDILSQCSSTEQSAFNSANEKYRNLFIVVKERSISVLKLLPLRGQPLNICMESKPLQITLHVFAKSLSQKSQIDYPFQGFPNLMFHQAL